MEGRVSALDELQGQLEVERKINQEWSEMAELRMQVGVDNLTMILDSIQVQAHEGGAHPHLQEAVTTIEGKEEEEEVDTKEAPRKVTREEMIIRGSTKSMAARTIWTTAPHP